MVTVPSTYVELNGVANSSDTSRPIGWSPRVTGVATVLVPGAAAKHTSTTTWEPAGKVELK